MGPCACRGAAGEAMDERGQAGAEGCVRWRHAWAAGLLLAGGVAQAQVDGALRWSGFGTLGVVRDNHSRIAPTRDLSQLPADGFATGAGGRLDSRLGIQAEYALTPAIDLVGQGVVRDQFDDDLDNGIGLAYAAWRPDSRLDLRVGRVNFDAFLMADHRHVGYAYPWVRPPGEFYGWIPIFAVDGLDAAYRFPHGDARWQFEAQAGRSRTTLPIGPRGHDFAASRLRGVSLSVESGPWRLKVAHSRFIARHEVPAFAPLHAGLDALAAAGLPGVSAEAADLRADLAFDGARIRYHTLGAVYDDGRWLVQGEIGRSQASAAVIPNGNMAYLGVARRFGNWQPFARISASRPHGGLRAAAEDWGGWTERLQTPALYTLNTTRIEQETLSLGVRWDLLPRLALKLQWDRSRIRPSGYGLWWRDIALNTQSARVELISLTVDFVF